MKFRIIVLGAEGVGKTSIIKQYLYGRFPLFHDPTLEDLHKEVVWRPDGVFKMVELLDTSGNKEDRIQMRTDLTTADAFMLVYAIDSISSFHAALKLVKKAIRLRKKRVPVLLLGYKADITKTREVSQNMAAESIRGKKNMTYMEASAKTKFQVAMSFAKLIHGELSQGH